MGSKLTTGTFAIHALKSQTVIRMTIEFANVLKHVNQNYLNLYLRSLIPGLSVSMFLLFDLLPRMPSHILLGFGIYVFTNSDS